MTVLFEIGSPASMAGGRVSSNAVAFNLMKWAIYNAATCATLNEWCWKQPRVELKVSPSSLWTLGHNVERRHLIAGATAKNKDLRECQAMLYFHARNPTKWVGLSEYLETL
jgi:hypothetical protein